MLDKLTHGMAKVQQTCVVNPSLFALCLKANDALNKKMKYLRKPMDQNLLNHKLIGQGQPLLILHGLFGTMDNWRTFSRALEKNFRVILVDLRNHGRSFWSDEFSYELLVGDLIRLLDHLGEERVHVLGHSMGGKTALQLLNEHFDRVDKTVIVDIANKEYSPGHEQIFQAVFGLDLSRIESRKQADEHLSEKIKDFSVRQFILKSLSRNPEHGYKWKTNFQSLHNNYKAILSSVDISNIENEVLFVRGTRSSYILDEDIRRLADLVPNAQFADIEGGHWLHAEKPDDLYQIVRSFLD